MEFPIRFKCLFLFFASLAPVALCATVDGTTTTSRDPKVLQREISDAARRASLDPKLVRAVISVESNFNPKAESSKGAMGLMQVRDQTAGECHIHDPFHALNNLMGACECLRMLINRYQGDLKLALAAYNAGPSNVDRFKGIPPFHETREYVRKVLAKYEKYKKEK
jgi:soluble lytic murein transglycosylase-like protein